MLQAECEANNRIRAIQAAQRDAHVRNRQWFQENLAQIVNILANIIDNLEDAAAAANLGQDGLNNGPPAEDECEDRPLALADPGQLETMDTEQMHDQLEQLLGALRHQIINLRNNAAQTGGATVHSPSECR